MSIEINKENGVCQLAVNDEMTIYTAATFKEEFLGHLAGCQEMEVNLSGVSEMDSAGLQIMLMLRLEASRTDKQVQFTNHSEAVIDVLEMLNLAAHFGDPIILPADRNPS